MTTGRINQVANPSSTLGVRTPCGTPEERRRAARATARRPTRGDEPGWARTWSVGGLGLCRRRGRSGGAGTRGPDAHPFGTRCCEPTGSWDARFPAGTLDLSARLGLDLVPVAWNGPFDALGIEFPTDGVRSVDNYEGPAQ